MGMVEDVATYLDAGSTALIVGDSLFLNVMPEHDNGTPSVCLQSESGGDATRTYGLGLPVSVSPTLVVITRSTAPPDSDYVDPRRALGLAWHVWSLLESVANQVVPVGSTSGTFVYAINGDSDPSYIGRDERRRAIFEQRLVADYAPSTDAY